MSADVSGVESWDKLNNNQKRFVSAYSALDFGFRKATQAMRDAGLTADHSSDIVSRVAAHRMTSNSNVRAVIAELIGSEVLSPEQIMRRRSEIASGNVSDLLDQNGRIDIKKAVAEGKTHLIRSVKQRPTKAGEEISVEMHDPQPSLKALETVHGLDKQVIEVETGDKLSELLAGMAAPWADEGESAAVAEE